jgi:NAD(P)-dependent dehydrogenase (short-subunit alcohol dehydrogenase family)
MNGALAGQSAIVVGGSSGIGLAAGLGLAAAGASVTVTGRSAEKLAAAKRQSEGRLATAAFDASDEAAVRAFFAAQAPFDHLVLCANAGGAMGAFVDLKTEALRTYFENKLWVYLHCLRAAPNAMRAGGSITLVNGGASRFGVPKMAALAIVNGGLDALVRPLAIELAPTRVNAIAPGMIDTPYWARLPEPDRANLYRMAGDGVPLKRVGTAAEVTQAIVFLASNRFVTGVVLDVDGGRHLTPNLHA